MSESKQSTSQQSEKQKENIKSSKIRPAAASGALNEMQQGN